MVFVNVPLAATVHAGHADVDDFIGTDDDARRLGAGHREQRKRGTGGRSRLQKTPTSEPTHDLLLANGMKMFSGDIPRASCKAGSVASIDDGTAF